MRRRNVGLKIAETCEVCGSSGWKIEKHGGRDIAVRCSCYEERKKQLRLAEAGIPVRYADVSLENFDPLGNPSLRAARRQAQRFVEQYPSAQSGLLFIGPPGLGKTHLAVSLLREVIQKTGDSALFVDYRDILKQIQESYGPESGTHEMSIIEPVVNCSLLVFDEIGAKRVSDWMHDTIFYILNQRYNEKRLTVMTTNFPEVATSPDEQCLIDRIGVRLESRLHEMCMFVPMEGDDFRKTQFHTRVGRTS